MTYDDFAVVLLQNLSFAACLYVAGGSVCRIRHPANTLKHRWRWVYVGLFRHALFSAAAITGGDIALREQFAYLLVALYLHLTAPAWRTGTPSMARPKY